ncbi:MAG: heme exporter protein A [Flavobacteriales bacterium]
MTETLINVESLCAERDGRVLFSGLDFSVETGQVIQVTGANGAGKTTLLRMLCGLLPVTAGEIYWCGKPFAIQRYEFSREVLFLGHAPGFKTGLSPRENLHWYFALRQNISTDDIDSALARVGLRGYEDTVCFQLSAGQQRRVALARLLISSARLWILDEPFTAIDKQGVGELETIISDHADSGGSVILTSHQDLSASANVTLISLTATEDMVASAGDSGGDNDE